MIIDCISDLHGSYPEMEGGDLLIVAGDLTANDTKPQYEEFVGWLVNQKYEKKVVIAGNHDMCIYKHKVCFQEWDEEFTYLCDSGVEYRGYLIWGSPWTRYFAGMNPACTGFTRHHDISMAEKWEKIPEDTDILVTHSPPYGILDHSDNSDRYGCRELREVVERNDPYLHIFGHIHEGYGQMQEGVTRFVNASHMNRRYEPVNKPIRVEL